MSRSCFKNVGFNLSSHNLVGMKNQYLGIGSPIPSMISFQSLLAGQNILTEFDTSIYQHYRIKPLIVPKLFIRNYHFISFLNTDLDLVLPSSRTMKVIMIFLQMSISSQMQWCHILKLPRIRHIQLLVSRTENRWRSCASM